MDELFMVFFMFVIYGMYFLLLGVLILLGVAQFVIEAISLHAVAKRRGIRMAWLSWLPIGNRYILGCISDHYQQVRYGKSKILRFILPFGPIAQSVVSTGFVLGYYVIAILLILFGSVLNGAITAMGLPSWGNIAMLFAVLLVYALLFAMALFVSVVSTAVVIVDNLAVFDLFASANTESAPLYLLLSLFVSFARPVLMFLSKNKDFGMVTQNQLPESCAE